MYFENFKSHFYFFKYRIDSFQKLIHNSTISGGFNCTYPWYPFSLLRFSASDIFLGSLTNDVVSVGAIFVVAILLLFFPEFFMRAQDFCAVSGFPKIICVELLY